MKLQLKAKVTIVTKVTNTFHKTVFKLLCDEDIVTANTDPAELAVSVPLRRPHVAQSRQRQQAVAASPVFIPRAIILATLRSQISICIMSTSENRSLRFGIELLGHAWRPDATIPCICHRRTRSSLGHSACPQQIHRRT